MKQEEIYLKTSEYIAKFKNGEKKYRESVLFNQVINMLVNDINPIDVIDQLITVAENTQRAFEQYIHRDTRPININGKNYTVNYEKIVNSSLYGKFGLTSQEFPPIIQKINKQTPMKRQFEEFIKFVTSDVEEREALYEILDDFLKSKSSIKCQDDLRREYKRDTGFNYNSGFFDEIEDDYDVDYIIKYITWLEDKFIN